MHSIMTQVGDFTASFVNYTTQSGKPWVAHMLEAMYRTAKYVSNGRAEALYSSSRSGLGSFVDFVGHRVFSLHGRVSHTVSTYPLLSLMTTLMVGSLLGPAIKKYIASMASYCVMRICGSSSSSTLTPRAQPVPPPATPPHHFPPIGSCASPAPTPTPSRQTPPASVDSPISGRGSGVGGGAISSFDLRRSARSRRLQKFSPSSACPYAHTNMHMCFKTLGGTTLSVLIPHPDEKGRPFLQFLHDRLIQSPGSIYEGETYVGTGAEHVIVIFCGKRVPFELDEPICNTTEGWHLEEGAHILLKRPTQIGSAPSIDDMELTLTIIGDFPAVNSRHCYYTFLSALEQLALGRTTYAMEKSSFEFGVQRFNTTRTQYHRKKSTMDSAEEDFRRERTLHLKQLFLRAVQASIGDDAIPTNSGGRSSVPSSQVYAAFGRLLLTRLSAPHTRQVGLKDYTPTHPLQYRDGLYTDIESFISTQVNEVDRDTDHPILVFSSQEQLDLFLKPFVKLAAKFFTKYCILESSPFYSLTQDLDDHCDMSAHQIAQAFAYGALEEAGITGLIVQNSDDRQEKFTPLKKSIYY